ncbi:polyphosphate kinase 1 [Verrucomicrobiales bacterium BCK34]|nr:polyphosphate kinase 1 [Verrucomicrobiales bacterium BCK34]
MGSQFRSKETSWLSFNARVLQEAADPNVPLFERIKFLGIYSSNLDEFFRVRVATLKRLATLGDEWKGLDIPDPNVTLRKVGRLVSAQAEDFNDAYAKVESDLEDNGIKLINENEVPEHLTSFLREYFRREVSPHIFPIILKASAKLPKLKDLPMYLAVKASKSDGSGRPMHALIEIPGNLPRFIPLPSKNSTRLVMYLDDIIRFGLAEVFATFPYDTYDSYAIKFTRDSELEFDDDFTESFYEKLEDSLKAREEGLPVRANFDRNFPKPFLNLILRKLNLARSDSLYPGARYHNRRDLLTFPKFGKRGLSNDVSEPIRIKAITKNTTSMFAAIRKKDLLIHTPYQPFRHLIRLLQEASIDPLVQSISMTQYRLAKDSCVASALQSAARNGKRVFVLVEPQARFDEQANIRWASSYRSAGVQVQLGVQGLKVHSKLIHIERRESGKMRTYSVLGTGNFNEDTATIFADHMLMTYDQEIGSDVAEIFQFFKRSYRPPKLRHLNVAPFDLRNFLKDRIDREIANHKAGKPAGLSFKVNNFSDGETNELIQKAADAGVPVRLIVRSMFSMVIDENSSIEAISIVDKYLEHSRLLIFDNENDPEVFLSSADFLPRNFDTRVETIFPINDKKLRKQMIDYFNIQWSDSTKARILDEGLTNTYRPVKGKKPVRSQFEIERYLRRINQ